LKCCFFSPFNHLTWLIACSPRESPWDAIRYSASEEIPCLLWNPKVHYHVHKGLPILMPWITYNKMAFHFELLAPCPTSKLGDQSVTVTIQYICSHPPYLEDAPSIHNPRKHHAMVTVSVLICRKQEGPHEWD
jgi:hypothetical protein